MARQSESVYRRRRIAFFGSTFIVAGLVVGASVVGLAPLPSASVSPVSVTDLTSSPAELAVPSFGTTVISAEGFGLLAEQNADTPAPIASIAKVITALVVLDAHPIAVGEAGPDITFDAADVEALARSIQNAESRADVIEGTSMSERDALTVMLVESANNYAWSLARWAFGSEEAYVLAANSWLSDHGFASTVVADASGLSPETLSTPRDLIGLGELALANDVTALAVRTTVTTIEPIGEIDNSNKLLGTLGINGVKTGTTDEAGSCLLFSADLPVGNTVVRVVGVTLGAPDHIELDNALTTFLQSVQGGFHSVLPVVAGQPVAAAGTPWDTVTNLVPNESVEKLVWSDTPVTLSMPSTTSSTGNANSVAGTATVTIGNEKIDVSLVRETDAPDPGFGWRVTHLDRLFGH
jgi:D-alanyl-D-alanine carboxypeptidase (penicillin-binding protein 5/6)